MSWEERLRPEIILRSPSGIVFRALWKGNDIRAEKRLGRHAYPNIDREVIQDMGMNSREVPLTVYFDGSDNDIISRNFELALLEADRWEVMHPVDGLLILQLMGYTRKIDVVENLNVTVFETEWLEPADEEDLEAQGNPVVMVETAIEKVNISIIETAGMLKTGKLSELRDAAKSVKSGLDKVKAAFVYADAIVMSVQNTINDMANNFYLYTSSLAGSIINIVEAPGLIVGSLQDKITMYVKLGNTIVEQIITAGGNTKENLNRMITGELFLDAILAGMAQNIIYEPPFNREEAKEIMERYGEFACKVREALEDAGSKLNDADIDNQYTVRAYSETAVHNLETAVTSYLMSVMLSKNISRRIVLEEPKTPLGLAIEEMGADASTADEMYKKICKWNNLHGKELLLLPAGREVVIYA